MSQTPTFITQSTLNFLFKKNADFLICYIILVSFHSPEFFSSFIIFVERKFAILSILLHKSPASL